MIKYHDKGVRYRDLPPLFLPMTGWSWGRPPIYDALISGSIHATGRLQRGEWYEEPEPPTVIDGSMFKYLKINGDEDMAVGGGLEFLDVRFHFESHPDRKLPTDLENAAALADLLSADKVPLVLTRANTAAAYAEHVRQTTELQGHGPTTQQDEDWRKSLGISRERVRELRRDTVPAEKKKGGRPPGN